MNILKDLKMNRVVSDATTINWHLGNHCQYSCSYCPPTLHANDSSHPNLEQMKELAIAAEDHLEFLDQKKQIQFTFSGGEPTLNPKFGPYVKWLKERGHVINLITNGGRTLRWWEEWGHNFNLVVFSFHPEFTEIDHFFQIVKHQTDLAVGATYVHLITWPDQFDRILEARTKLSEINRCRIITKKITEDWLGPEVSMTPYSADQLIWINNNLMTGTTNRYIESNFRVEGTINSNRQVIPINPIIIRNYKLNQFLGWKCQQGFKNLSIDVYGKIWGAHCQQNQMGSLDAISKIEWPDSVSVCRSNFCHCSSDTMITKSPA